MSELSGEGEEVQVLWEKEVDAQRINEADWSRPSRLAHSKSLALEEEAAKSPVLIHLSGFAFLILGVLLVVSHSVWTFD